MGKWARGAVEAATDKTISVAMWLLTAIEVTDAELCSGLQAAGDGYDDSDSQQAETDDTQRTPAFTLASALQSLDNVRVYLVAAGCALYEQFYSLIDQV